jgi:DNA/RNA-binding domain of Phe-tRNA-synthetase-like protein
MLTLEPHPLLDVAVLVSTFPSPLGDLPTSDAVRALSASIDLLVVDGGSAPKPRAPLHSDEGVCAAVRDLLRHGGYKPTGRGKPSSEYLIRAVSEGALGSINAAVDTGNAVSLHSGLPVSVIDLDRARPPLRVAVAPAGASYVFNASGQVIDLGGLICLGDTDGPCANGVKDAQRTKTSAATTRTLSVLWGTRALPGRTAEAAAWYQHLLEEMGARVERAA